MSKWVCAVLFPLSLLCGGNHSFVYSQTDTSASPAAAETATSRLVADVDAFLALLKQGDYAKASADLETLVAAQWNDSFARYVALRLNEAFQLESMGDKVQTACVASPKDAALRRLSSYLHLLEDRGFETRRIIDQSINLDATNASIFFLRGQSLLSGFFIAGIVDSDMASVSDDDAAKGIADTTQAIRLNPNAPAYYLLRARFLAVLKNRDAFKDTQELIKLEYNPGEVLMLMGKIYSRLGDHQSAADAYTAAISQYEQQSSAENRDRYVDYSTLLSVSSPLTLCYFERGNAKGACKQYRGAIDDFNAAAPGLNEELKLELYEDRAEMYIGLKDYPAALADFNSASDSPHFDARRRAWVKLQLKDYQGAIDDYDESIRDRDWESRMGRGIAKSHLGDIDGALDDLDAAIEFAGLFKAEPLIARGMVYLKAYNFEKALADFNHAIEVDPKNAGAYYQRGLTHHALKNYSAAIKDFGEVTTLDRGNVSAWFNFGLSLRSLGHPSNAVKAFDIVIMHDPKHLRGYYLRGLCKHDLGENAAAIADYDAVLSLDPEYSRAYIQRALAKIHVSDFKSALADYDAALQIDKDSVKALTAKSFLLSTCNDQLLRNAEQASDLANRALKLDEYDPYAMNVRACADAAAGDYQSAIAWEEKAIKIVRYASDKDIDGGHYAEARINAWKANTLWTVPPK